jgi:sec-independent protein translocase protein TatA
MLRNGLEPWHIVLMAVVCLLLFGSKRLPDAARGLGKSMRILKSEARAMKNENNDRDATTPTTGTAERTAEAPRPAVADVTRVTTVGERTAQAAEAPR